MASPLRQKLLERTQKGHLRRVITIGEGEEAISVEVRTPTLAESLKFASAKEGDLVEQYKGMVRSAIACSFDPNTGERIFDPTDEDVLMEQTSTVKVLEPILKALGELVAEAQNEAKN